MAICFVLQVVCHIVGQNFGRYGKTGLYFISYELEHALDKPHGNPDETLVKAAKTARHRNDRKLAPDAIVAADSRKVSCK